MSQKRFDKRGQLCYDPIPRAGLQASETRLQPATVGGSNGSPAITPAARGYYFTLRKATER